MGILQLLQWTDRTRWENTVHAYKSHHALYHHFSPSSNKLSKSAMQLTVYLDRSYSDGYRPGYKQILDKSIAMEE
jgi:hypothetical protein